MTYNWDFNSIWPFWDLFLWGLWISVLYTIGSIFFGVIIGFLTCAARLSSWKVLNLIARCYQEIFRCTPLLVQLLWFYYAFPLLLGGTIDNRVAAMLTLSLYVGAFYAEIFRGGIVSIDRGQREAAAAIGMSPWQSMTRIILPQALEARAAVLHQPVGHPVQEHFAGLGHFGCRPCLHGRGRQRPDLPAA